MPHRPTPPTPPGGRPPLPDRPVPEALSSGKIKPTPVARPAGDLSPKFKAGAKIGAVFGVLVIIGASVTDISRTLGLNLPTVITSVLGILATLGGVYAKAGDGR